MHEIINLFIWHLDENKTVKFSYRCSFCLLDKKNTYILIFSLFFDLFQKLNVSLSFENRSIKRCRVLLDSHIPFASHVLHHSMGLFDKSVGGLQKIFSIWLHIKKQFYFFRKLAQFVMNVYLITFITPSSVEYTRSTLDCVTCCMTYIRYWTWYKAEATCLLCVKFFLKDPRLYGSDFISNHQKAPASCALSRAGRRRS